MTIKFRYSRSGTEQSRVLVFVADEDETDIAFLCQALDGWTPRFPMREYKKRLRGSGIERVCELLDQSGKERQGRLAAAIRDCRDRGEARAEARAGIVPTGYDDPAVRAAVTTMLRRMDSSLLVYDSHTLSDDTDSPMLFGEVCLNKARADLAIVTPESLHLFEVKSCRDSLSRLTHQVPEYDAFSDTSTLCTTDTHLDKAMGLIPQHWGVVVVRDDVAVELRPAQTHGLQSKTSMLALMWNSELHSLIREYAPDIKGVSRMNRRALAKTAGECMSREEVIEEFRWVTSHRWRAHHGRGFGR